MTTTQILAKVREDSRANERDYADATIQLNVEQEYAYILELMKDGQRVQVNKDQTPTVLSFTAQTTDFIPTDPNLHIERIEVSTDSGVTWYPVERTNKTTFNLAEQSGGCRCSAQSFQDSIEDNDYPAKFIQTLQGVHVFPIPDGGVDVKIHIEDDPIIDWNDPNFVPLIPTFAIPMLTLKATMMYRDIEDTNDLNFLQSQYNTLHKRLLKHIGHGGKVIQMGIEHQSFM